MEIDLDRGRRKEHLVSGVHSSGGDRGRCGGVISVAAPSRGHSQRNEMRGAVRPPSGCSQTPRSS